MASVHGLEYETKSINNTLNPAPEVTGSTLLTQALLAPLGLPANINYNNYLRNDILSNKSLEELQAERAKLQELQKDNIPDIAAQEIRGRLPLIDNAIGWYPSLTKNNPVGGDNNIARTEFYNDVNAIIRISKLADKSSILHELGHVFLKDFQNLAKSGLLKGLAKQDWNTLLKSYGLTEIDFNNMSDEDRSAWYEAHEKFATDFERYLMTGESPNAKLKHVFEAFKRWLTEIYKSVHDIKYIGSDNNQHSLELSDNIKKVMADILSEGDNEGEKQSELNLPFDPSELRTENGNTIEEASNSEMLITPEGNKALTNITQEIADIAGIAAGEVQANVGFLRHAENEHGEQIRKAGYKNVQEFMLDVLNNWNEIREGTENSLWLVIPHDENHRG